MANFQKDKKYNFTYKTTNLINKRYYLGMHSTNNLNDDYIGSGTRLWYEIRKYGKENFKIEILNYYISREELINAEKALITEDDLNNNNCLNLKPGGCGGFNSAEHQLKCSKAGNYAFKQKLKNNLEFKNYIKQINSINSKKAINKNPPNWKGKNHSEETKQKMSEIKKGKGKGKSNSQYSTIWITNGKENKKIKKQDIIPNNWYKGRILNRSMV